MVYHYAWNSVLLYLKFSHSFEAESLTDSGCRGTPRSSCLSSNCSYALSHLHSSYYLDVYCKGKLLHKNKTNTPHPANAGGAQNCNLLLYQTVVSPSPSYHYRVFLEYKINLGWLYMIGGQNTEFYSYLQNDLRHGLTYELFSSSVTKSETSSRKPEFLHRILQKSCSLRFTSTFNPQPVVVVHIYDK